MIRRNREGENCNRDNDCSMNGAADTGLDDIDTPE
jgi:hypothetical protein